MTEEFEIETYLSISKNKYVIYLFDTKNLNNLYKEEINFENKNNRENFININELSQFLENNIFKIEKLIGKFIKNIYLIIENSKAIDLNFGIRKKNYNETINQKFLKNIITDAKDLFKENYQDEKILHILIKKYIIDGNEFTSLNYNLAVNQLCIEVEFKSITSDLVFKLDKVLEKYQIKVDQYLDGNYIKNITYGSNLDFSEKIFKVKTGFNENEVMLIPKNLEKKGFFEKFFQLFS